MCHLCATQGRIEQAIHHLQEAELLIGDYWLQPETYEAWQGVRLALLELQKADANLETITDPNHPPYKAGKNV